MVEWCQVRAGGPCMQCLHIRVWCLGICTGVHALLNSTHTWLGSVTSHWKSPKRGAHPNAHSKLSTSVQYSSPRTSQPSDTACSTCKRMHATRTRFWPQEQPLDMSRTAHACHARSLKCTPNHARQPWGSCCLLFKPCSGHFVSAHRFEVCFGPLCSQVVLRVGNARLGDVYGSLQAREPLHCLQWGMHVQPG